MTSLNRKRKAPPPSPEIPTKSRRSSRISSKPLGKFSVKSSTHTEKLPTILEQKKPQKLVTTKQLAVSPPEIWGDIKPDVDDLTHVSSKGKHDGISGAVVETSEIKVEYEADLDLVDDFVNRVFQDGDSFQGSTGVGTSSEDETENSNDDDPEFYVSSESKPIRRGVRRRTVVKKSNHSEGPAIKYGAIGPLPFKCGPCGKSFSKLVTLNRHASRGHPFACLAPKCDFKFDSETARATHVKTTHPDVFPRIRCALCNRAFAHENALAAHMVARHETGEKIFSCPQCTKSFALEANFTRHVTLYKVEADKPIVCDVHIRLRHTGEKPEKCDRCGKSFIDKHCLLIHSKHDHPFACHEPSCPLTFNAMKLRDTHVKTAHPGISTKYPCTSCTSTFSRASCLARHVRTYHDNKFSCDKCNKTFSFEENLQQHMASVHEGNQKFVCGTCDAILDNETELAKHVKKHHDKKGGFVCNQCGIRCSLKSGLERHMRRHLGAKSVKCEQRGESCFDKAALAKHVNLVHLPSIHICHVCGKNFPLAKRLSEHIKRHRPDKPMRRDKSDVPDALKRRVVCTDCKEEFLEPRTLKAHRIKHHGDDPWVCDICGSTFATANGFAIHAKAHSGEKPYKCDVSCC
ncbi:Zinc finger protein 26 [Folsomia candida]|uniref:Zinc finger protein 26 n=1 Tax=Folsomia candida TaxID=158441 RepID=A0A226DC08_FOLCA|nr:Zinc finger protein 26 [Folsomia candida]